MPTFRSRVPLALFSLALLALGILSFSAPTAHANPGILHVKMTGAASGTCADWDHPCTLPFALSIALSSDEIWVAAGTYTPGTNRTDTFTLKAGVAIYGGFDGAETARTERNITANVTTLSGEIGAAGNSDNSYHVVTGGAGLTATAVLDGFTVTGGAGASLGGGMTNSTGSPTLSNLTFSDNSAIDGGGGIFNLNGSPTLSNVTFSGNSAWNGGGLFNDGGSPTLSNITFSSHSISGGGGGMFSKNGNPSLVDVTFTYNSAADGGGMYSESGDPTVTNVTFTSNSATSDGGGMYIESGSPVLTNVTFAGNSTSWAGGGMYNFSGGPSLTNVTFTSNHGDHYGGGVYCYAGSSNIRNTILWGNTAFTAGSQISSLAGTITISHSVVQGDYAGGTNIITADPLLGALGDWGGSTQTIRLLPGSSAIEKADYATCPATDQRGKPRLGTCDIGAFEFQGYTFSKTGGDWQTALVTLPFAQSLKVTLRDVDTSSPVASVPITFTAPASGASATWSGNTSRTATTNASGIATVEAPVANGVLGSYEISASVWVDAPPPTMSVSFFLTNAQAETATSLASSANPSVSGQAVTLTATVSGSSPTGTVTFQDDGDAVPDCAAVPLSGGAASCTRSSLTVGTHTITASYGGNATNAASSGSVPQVVNKASTAVVLTSSPNPSTTADDILITVTVTAVAPASGTPTGTVELQETVSLSAPTRTVRQARASQTLVNGNATFTIPSLDAGSHNLVAVYGGDLLHDPSTSPALTHLVIAFYLTLPLVAR